MLGYILHLKLKILLNVLIFFSIFTFFLLKIFNIKNNDYPIILWWTPIVPEGERLINCYKNEFTCLVTKNKTYKNQSAFYMFYGSHLDNNDFPLPRDNKLWALLHEESPRNYGPILYENFQNLFNITSTFSQNSDFPITLQYLPNISILTDTKYFKATREKNLHLKNAAPILYIQSNCDTPIQRDYLVKELMKHIKVDSYGTCLKNKQFPIQLINVHALDLFNNNLLEFISNYKFTIAFENAICEDYITEKFWRPLLVGSVPIYLGSPSIEKWMPNDNSAILLKNFNNISSLADNINLINNNDTLYETYLEHKLFNKISNNLLKQKMSLGQYGLESNEDHPITAFECFVCKQIYEGRLLVHKIGSIYDCPKPKTFNNVINSWIGFWDIAKCQAKALVTLITNNKSFLNESYEKEWKTYESQNIC